MIRTFIVITLIFFPASSMALTITKDQHVQADPADGKKRRYILVPIDSNNKNDALVPVRSEDSELPLCVLYTGEDGKLHGYSPLEERRKQRVAENSFLNSKNRLNWLWFTLRGSFAE